MAGCSTCLRAVVPVLHAGGGGCVLKPRIDKVALVDLHGRWGEGRWGGQGVRPGGARAGGGEGRGGGGKVSGQEVPGQREGRAGEGAGKVSGQECVGACMAVRVCMPVTVCAWCATQGAIPHAMVRKPACHGP